MSTGVWALMPADASCLLPAERLNGLLYVVMEASPTVRPRLADENYFQDCATPNRQGPDAAQHRVHSRRT